MGRTVVLGPNVRTALGELARRYREIDDSQPRRIAARYGASHAVIYRDTPSAFPTLGESLQHIQATRERERESRG